MATRRALASLLAVILGGPGCGESGHLGAGSPEALTVRVTAGDELSPFVSSLEGWTGATAYVTPLAYLPLALYVDDIRVDGARVTCKLRRGSPLSSRELGERLERHRRQGLRVVSVAADELVLEFDTKRTLDLAMRPGFPLVEDGPFTPCSEQPPATAPVSRIDLCARPESGAAIEHIEIRSVPEAQQWYALYRGSADVIPILSSPHMRYFRAMKTLRVLTYPAPRVFALFINTAREPWSDPDVRRQLASRLDRGAVARAICDSDVCRVPGWAFEPPRRAVALPEQIELVVLSSESEYFDKALRYHLRRELGARVVSIRAPLGQLEERRKQGEYDLLLLPLQLKDDADLVHALSKIESAARYDVSALEALVAQGRADDVHRAIERDVPMIPVFQYEQFAVVDRRFCGGKPTDSRSWAWLADLHPCGPEEQQ